MGMEAKDGVKWADLFKILQHYRLGLIALKVTPRIASITTEDARLEADSETVKLVQKRLEGDSSLHVFGYGHMREWEDAPSKDHELNLEAFMLGDDMREFAVLMDVIARNVKAKRRRLD